MAEPDLDAVLRYLDGAEGWASCLSQVGVDWLSNIVLSTLPSHVSYAQGVRRLRRLCRETGLVPTSCQVPLAVFAESATPFSQTAFSDVWSAILDGRRVAVKALRLHGDQMNDVRRAYLHELILWRCLRHPNIVPFIGTSEHFPVSLVSEWMTGGTVTAFLRGYPNWERSFLVIDILQGLGFMHSLDVVHGDLKPENVLVDFQGQARLTDFGLAITLNATVASATLNGMGTLQYMAPELFEDGRPTKASDVYALGMTSWHIYSGIKPFAELSSSLALARRVLAGTRPPRTKEMDGLKLTGMQWLSIVAAWDQEPTRRPVLSSGGEPMIFSWRPETEMIHSTSHQPDLSAAEARDALERLWGLLHWSHDGDGLLIFESGIKGFSSIVRLGRLPIRHHEDTLLQSLHDRVRIKHKPADYDSPYLKIFVLLQAHFSRLELSPELAADLAIVLEHIFFLFSVFAHRDWSNSNVDLDFWWPFPIFRLMHMCVHGVWDDSPELRQIPYFEDDVIARFSAASIWSVRDVVNMKVHKRNKLLKMDAQKIQDVEAFLSSYPALSVTTLFLERDQLRAGKQIILEVTLRQTVPGAEGCGVDVTRIPRKHPVKWWVGVQESPPRYGWFAHEYVTVAKVLTVRLKFVLPQGWHSLTLHVRCDSYMGLDHSIRLGEIWTAS